MKLKDWRISRRLTLHSCAEALGLTHARNYQRYELGMVMADAPMIERIELFTSGEVTVVDMFLQRKAWLLQNKPETLTGLGFTKPFQEAAE